jgi:hypothetical protein
VASGWGQQQRPVATVRPAHGGWHTAVGGGGRAQPLRQYRLIVDADALLAAADALARRTIRSGTSDADQMQIMRPCMLRAHGRRV